MKTKITKPLLSSLSLVAAMILLLTGCSGGNAGSSSGSGGTTEPGTTDTSGGTSAIDVGEYMGNINFSRINDSAPINIDIQNNNNVVVTSNDTGSANGSTSGSSFSASGVLSFILTTQTCNGLTTVTGSGSGNTLNGTVTVSSANCVDNGVMTTISLNGSFSATQ